MGRLKDAEKVLPSPDMGFIDFHPKYSDELSTLTRKNMNLPYSIRMYLTHYLMELGPNTKKIPQNSGKQIRIPEGM